MGPGFGKEHRSGTGRWWAGMVAPACSLGLVSSATGNTFLTLTKFCFGGILRHHHFQKAKEKKFCQKRFLVWSSLELQALAEQSWDAFL